MALTDMPTRSAKRALAEPDWSGFLAELTLLSERYGIAVAESGSLYAMKADDHGYDYSLDAEGRLTRR